MKRLLFIVNEDWFFLSHRLPIAEAARDEGYEVHVAANPSSACKAIQDAGIIFHPLSLSRSGASPWQEFRSLVDLHRLMKEVRPTVVHLVTIKPVLYGGVVARLLGLATVAAVTGLGHAFTGGGFLKRSLQTFLLAWYRLALGSERCHVIVQNPSDELMLRTEVGIPKHQISLIEGSGVDLLHYQATPEPSGPVVVTMAARLLRDKGVFEFAEAARLVRARRPEVSFLLAGDPDPGNPSSLTAEDLKQLNQMGHVEICGYQNDIQSLFARSHIVVLPSYREGLPKVLIEAAACGRAVITTDAPGCRDAVWKDRSGLIVPVRDPKALAEAIHELIEHPTLRKRMGSTGREFAEARFDLQRVIEVHLHIYHNLT